MASRQQMAKLRADVAARRRSGASLASIREMGNEQRCRSDSAELSATDSAELSLDTSLDTSRPGERIAPSVSPRGEQSSSTSTTLTTATSAAASPSLATVVATAAASDASRYHVDAALAVSSEDNTADALARRMLKQQRDFAERGRRAEVYVQLMLAGAIALVSIVAFAVHGLHTHGLLRLAHDHAVLSVFGFACPLLGFGASKMIQPDLSPSLLSSRLTSVFLALVGIFLSLLLALVASVVRSVVLSSALNLALAAVATAAGWSMLYIASPTTVGTLTTSELATREFDGSAWQQQRRRRRSSGELSTSRQLSTTGSTGSSHTKQRRRSRSGSGAGVAGLALPDALPLGASPTGGGSTNGTKGNNLALLNELDAPGAMPDADAAKFVDASSSEWFSSHGGGGGGGGGGRVFVKPKQCYCYLCAREFGTSSLKIHWKGCQRRFVASQKDLPRHRQQPLPAPPNEQVRMDEGDEGDGGGDEGGTKGGGFITWFIMGVRWGGGTQQLRTDTLLHCHNDR